MDEEKLKQTFSTFRGLLMCKWITRHNYFWGKMSPLERFLTIAYLMTVLVVKIRLWWAWFLETAGIQVPSPLATVEGDWQRPL